MAGWASTGLEGLDKILTGLQKGDNVVWQVDSVQHFRSFVRPYVSRAARDGRKLVYMRFAAHPPLVEPGENVAIHNLDANSGFETFSSQVHNIITDEGKEAYYVFDCLSDLLSAWVTDLMIGNFFLITCPYLFELDTIAYFALLRDKHSYKTIARIRETTQILLDLYSFEGSFHVHPLKVWRRYSPTMFLPHIRKGDEFVPITTSVDAARLISYFSRKGPEPAQRALDYWDRVFLDVEELCQRVPASSEQRNSAIEQLCRMMIGREERILSLAQAHFSLEDLLDIRKRMIGTGFIGGKAVGMLLANKVISADQSLGLSGCLEPHDSFYVGSDVFYTYLVENGWWNLRMEQKSEDGYFKVASELRERLLTGKFPDQICEQFREMIEYFGQSPIIVRSSSLLEDAFGNAFAGKYESLFCVNQGDPDERYRRFEEAVRRVYASTMGQDALTYRLQRGLDQEDEQMALLVQRVSGSHRNGYFFPDLAGVGMSHNPFVWKPDMDPKAGMLRLVFGLGTRAVNRVEDDYPRIVALDAPLTRPVAGMDDVRKYSQRRVDLLDTRDNSLRTVAFDELLAEGLDIELDYIAVNDPQLSRQVREQTGRGGQYRILTFKKLFSQTSFVPNMQKILKALERAYSYPVDVEFTANFTEGGSTMINLLQCRPLQTKGSGPHVTLPAAIKPEKIIFKTEGCFMGGCISQKISRLVHIDPEGYSGLPLSHKYDIARLIGKLNRLIRDKLTDATMLLGPGRWGTSTPSLGVPVSFHEISNAAVLVEMAYESAGLMPELSFGTHFFQDLVETNIFYVALFPSRDNVVLNRDRLLEMPNLLAKLVPEAGKYDGVVHVCETGLDHLRIVGDMLTQKAVCYFE
ncbi:MAG: PEP/pyruvate-binding domain-containing protein [Sedimentisphaerales bacterium]|nr:PEP/pyruvate-binding domain-containing protein [Sedimentisphaerales bacterium]